MLALLVFEYLGPILRHHARYLQVDDLPGFIAGFLIAAARQNASINRQDFDLIRIGNRLERCAGTALLPPRLAAALPYGLLPAIGIHRRRLAAVLTVEAQPIHNERHQKQQHLKTGFERR